MDVKLVHVLGIVLAIGLGSASTLFAQPRPMRLPEGVMAHRDIAYVENGHARNQLDLYIPKSDAPLPVVVWIHGGAWLAGNKSDCPALFLIEKGYAVVSINYRLSQHALFPAQIEDCKAAVRWIRAHAKQYHLNPDRIGVWGASAGGHLAALLGTTGDLKSLEGQGGNADQSSRVQCVIDYFGPTDFTRMGGSHENPHSPESKLIGGAIPKNLDKSQRANPIAYITQDDPPFLIVHGDKDAVVPYIQSQLLMDALSKAKVPAELIPITGAGHGGPRFDAPENRQRVEAFLAKHLQGTK